MESSDTELLRREYETVYPVAVNFAASIEEQLSSLMDGKPLSLGVPIEKRIKTWTSIKGKIERKNLLLSSVRELDDLVGLRVITLFLRDLQTIQDLLQDNFEILHTEDAGKKLDEAHFGYQSVHYVLALPHSWLNIPTMKEFKGLRAEVQVRSLAQHIWAAASHKLQYKRESSVPEPIRRSISRASALLETVDLEFERVLAEREDYLNDVKESEVDELELNVDLLNPILSTEFPLRNKEYDEPYAELLEDLNAFNINKVKELKNLIEKNWSCIWEREKSSLEETAARLEAKQKLYGTSKERLEAGVYFTHVGLARAALHCQFGEEWNEFIKSASRERFHK